jgi:hypothetical protein
MYFINHYMTLFYLIIFTHYIYGKMNVNIGVILISKGLREYLK